MTLQQSFDKSLALLPKAKQAAAHYRLRWINLARRNQITPSGDWRVWLILAGRGFGKTRTGAEDVADYAMWNDGVRVAVVAPTAADARDTCVEGESGLLACIPHECIEGWNRSLGELILTNGSRFKLFSAEEPSRLRGPQHHRAWCDEISSWQYPDAWDQLMFGLRLGDDPRVVATTTPKPTKLMRELLARRDRDVLITHGRTMDNAANLPQAALDNLIARYAGTRLGRQELDAEMLDDTPGALWKRSDIDAYRVNAMPAMRRIVIAIDPAVSTKEGSDETGIVAAGIGEDGYYYVVSDKSSQYTPNQWATVAINEYKLLMADRIIGEQNNGGDMVENNIRMADPEVSYKSVYATKGKAVRAEPVAALYEQGRVRHVGSMPILEDQMCNFTTDYDRAKMHYSPDRLDALVWALTELAIEVSPGQNILDFYAGQKREAEIAKQKASGTKS